MVVYIYLCDLLVISSILIMASNGSYNYAPTWARKHENVPDKRIIATDKILVAKQRVDGQKDTSYFSSRYCMPERILQRWANKYRDGEKLNAVGCGRPRYLTEEDNIKVRKLYEDNKRNKFVDFIKNIQVSNAVEKYEVSRPQVKELSRATIYRIFDRTKLAVGPTTLQYIQLLMR